MNELSALRSLGHDGLAELLRLRPELLEPRPPASLRELQGRLNHPLITLAAVRRLDLPTLQVLQVLCALRGRATRAEALRLLGTGPGPGGAPASGGGSGTSRAAGLDRAIATLRSRGLLATLTDDGDAIPSSVVQSLWPRPLGLSEDVETLATGRTVDQLRGILTRLEQPVAGRKPELVTRLVETLRDGAFVRQLVQAAPREFAGQLVDVAFGRSSVDRFSHGATYWGTSRSRTSPSTPDDPRTRPVDWAVARFLLVVRPEGYGLTMPSEVALALRGEGWTTQFTPDPPPLTWTARPAEVLESGALAAAATALRGLDAVLTAAGRRPLAPLKAGGVGVRELRRLATDTGLATGEARLCLELAASLRLLSIDGRGYAPTAAFDAWRSRPSAARYDGLLRAWKQLTVSPALEPAAAWDPRSPQDSSPTARTAVCSLLAEHPFQAPGSPDALEKRLHWQLPLLMGTMIHSDTGGRGDDSAAEEVSEHCRLIRAVLTEAAWLGVTSADALSPAGMALVTGGDVRAAVGERLGVTRASALLQADLTATVLGEPDTGLATFLDLIADREGRSTASVWRFSPASVRRALDAGRDADDLLARLAGLADGGVPQPLEYLIRDVARRHGAVRGRAVACYLRSDDEALLSEIVADRRLRTLGLSRIAPTVVIGSKPWPQTVEALRSAGYAPVEEDALGGTVVAPVAEHRALTPDDHVLDLELDLGLDDGDDPDTFGETSDPDASDPDASDPDVVAGALLAGADSRGGMLLDLGGTVVEIGDPSELRFLTR